MNEPKHFHGIPHENAVLTQGEKKIIFDTLEVLQKEVITLQQAVLNLQDWAFKEAPGCSEDEQPGAGLPWGGERP